MSAIPSTSSSLTSNNTSNTISTALSQVDTDQFLQLMIEELQNQDPLDPTDSTQFLQQITQIREIGASDQLSVVLDRVLEGQNLNSASSLIGKQIKALDDVGSTVEGVVDRVSVDVDDALGNRTLRVHIGDHSVSLANIRQINEAVSE